MKIFKNFLPKEKKSFNLGKTFFVGAGNSFSFIGQSSNQSQEFINYYNQNCPVFTGVQLIRDTIASITPVVFDSKKNEFVDHEIIKLLNKPNPFINYQLFIEELVTNYIVSGNFYMNIIGTTKPNRLDSFKPYDINILENQRDGYASEYLHTSTNGNESYFRNETFQKENRARFLAKNGNELVHFKKYNIINTLYGSSQLSSCELEIGQYMQASIHNYCLLKNQATPSGIISFKGDASYLSEDQMEGMQDMVNKRLKGANNAGSPLVLTGDFQWQQLSESVKDMNFENLKKDTEKSISKVLKIPLPLISEDASTFNNYEQAQLQFYYGTILPLTRNIFKFLTDTVLKKYPKSENLSLAFDPSSIKALNEKQTKEAVELSASGVLTINEIRTKLGYESLPIGGDTIYQPLNLVPVGQDGFTSDNRESPSKSLVKTMTKITNPKGEPFYSAKEILKAVNEIENE